MSQYAYVGLQGGKKTKEKWKQQALPSARHAAPEADSGQIHQGNKSQAEKRAGYSDYLGAIWLHSVQGNLDVHQKDGNHDTRRSADSGRSDYGRQPDQKRQYEARRQ